MGDAREILTFDPGGGIRELCREKHASMLPEHSITLS